MTVEAADAAIVVSRRRRIRVLAAAGPTAALLLLSFAFAMANPKFLTAANLKNLADQSAIPLVLGVGMTFVILLGAIDLSVEGNLATTSLVVALVMADQTNALDIGSWGILLGVIVGVVFGFVNGFVSVSGRIPTFMVTLGTWSIGLGIGQILFGGEPPRLELSARAWGIDRLFFGVTNLFFVALGVILIGWLIQRQTKLGRYAYAIGGGEEMAKQSGINVGMYKIFLFTLAGAAFGLAGAMLLARTGVGDIRAVGGFLFTTISGVVIGGTLLSGGRGGVLHSSVGILTMVVLRNGMILSGVDQFFQDAVQGFILIAVLVITAWPNRRRMRFVA